MSVIRKDERQISGLMKAQHEELRVSREMYGSKPYKTSREAFQEYLKRRQAEDAKRRAGGK